MKSKRTEIAVSYDGRKTEKVSATYLVEHKGIETTWYINTDWYCPQPDENPYWKNDVDNVEDKIVEHIKLKFRKFVKTYFNEDNFVM